MTSLLQELSKRLLDRWGIIVLGPGLLFVACAVMSVRLGQSHAVDVHRLRDLVDRGGAGSPTGDTAGAVLVVAAVAVASAACGLGAVWLGRLIERAWTPTGGGALADWATRRRHRRWQRADRRFADAIEALGPAIARQRRDAAPTPRVRGAAGEEEPLRLGPADARGGRGLRRLRARRDRISPAEPGRATWLADRLDLVERRVSRYYHFELRAAWPHLWSVAPPALRADLTAAQDSYAGAARLCAWGIGYLLLGVLWWPSVLVAAIALSSGRSRARDAIEVLATLLEAAVDLHGRELATGLGIDCPGPLTPSVGAEIGRVLAKEPPAATVPAGS